MLASFRIARRLVPLLVVLLGASCVNSGSPASSSSSREDPAIPEGRGLVTENPDGSRTVRSAYGTATVPAQPQRVVSVIGDIDFETLLALGMKPVGAGTQGGNLDSGFAPHLAGRLEGVQPLAWSDGAPIEAIAALKPDLIFVPNEETARQLEKVAPVVPRGSWVGTQWKEDFLYLAEVVGRSADAKRLLSDYEARARSLRDRIAPKVEGKTVLSPQVAYDHAQVYVDSDDALSGAVLTELGMTLHEVALRDDEDGISVSLPAVTSRCRTGPGTFPRSWALSRSWTMWKRLSSSDPPAVSRAQPGRLLGERSESIQLPCENGSAPGADSAAPNPGGRT